MLILNDTIISESEIAETIYKMTMKIIKENTPFYIDGSDTEFGRTYYNLKKLNCRTLEEMQSQFEEMYEVFQHIYIDSCNNRPTSYYDLLYKEFENYIYEKLNFRNLTEEEQCELLEDKELLTLIDETIQQNHYEIGFIVYYEAIENRICELTGAQNL